MERSRARKMIGRLGAMMILWGWAARTVVVGTAAFVLQAPWQASAPLARIVHVESRTIQPCLATSMNADAALLAANTACLPRLSMADLEALQRNKYVAVRNFLNEQQVAVLQADISELRATNQFKVARIGQDATNTLNTNIRVAETCFIGRDKSLTAAQSRLHDILDQVRVDLQTHFGTPLEASLTELLYAFYPQGGYYRRHRDAVAGSASVLRTYSLLLYLNNLDWDVEKDGGQLRLHLDGGGDACPDSVPPNFVDVEPLGGTLVLLQSDAVPHEVLNTQRERKVVVGWYNRPVSVRDVGDLAAGSSGMSPTRLAMLGVSALLVTVGLAQILSQ